MINDIIYLDNAATTKPFKEVVEAMIPYLSVNFGNPSSIYSLGGKSKVAIEKARVILARDLNCSPNEVFFTSSGTESDNWALKGVAEGYRNKGRHIITSKIEHPAILSTCRYLEDRGYEITYLNVDKNGIVSIEELKKLIRKDTILVSIMYANNEIGTIQPIQEIGEICKDNNTLFHTDAVQAYGLYDIDIKKLNIDLFSISSHKINGPKGVGALYVKDGIILENFIHGGSQEKDKRGSTENVAGVVGFGKAIELTSQNREENRNILLKNRDYFMEKLKEKIPNTKINGDIKNRLANNINVTFENINAESLLMALDMNNIAASSGSACSSGTIESSHVLDAIGLSKKNAKSTIRFSIGIDNSKEDLEYVIDTLKNILEKMENY
ncbi:cysteine desulfurase [Peptostreptococcaceae bacterium OttesenSCG-928-C18]|nr:cysteine desulfurase [Peptostreptococcaceae bacterium OttesenSCG-928-C18]